MSRKKENCDARNKAIYNEYKKLSDKKTPKGKQLLSFEAVLEELSSKFFLSEGYIEKILKNHK